MNKTMAILVMLLISISSITFAQTKEELKTSALRDAKITSAATLALDFETVFKHTYPNIIEVMGGKEKALKLIKTAFDSMKEQGMVFEKVEIKHVSDVIFEEGQYRCYIEGYNQIRTDDMRVKSKSFLFGIYNDKDKIWYFLEAEKLKNKGLTDMILPNFKTSLEIPNDEVTTEQI